MIRPSPISTPRVPMYEGKLMTREWQAFFRDVTAVFGKDGETAAVIDHSTVSDAPTKAALDALGVKINNLITKLEQAGILEEV